MSTGRSSGGGKLPELFFTVLCCLIHDLNNLCSHDRDVRHDVVSLSRFKWKRVIDAFQVMRPKDAFLIFFLSRFQVTRPKDSFLVFSLSRFQVMRPKDSFLVFSLSRFQVMRPKDSFLVFSLSRFQVMRPKDAFLFFSASSYRLKFV
uniref:Uncharacterized protein n=1 Tax=Cacopsylla melanoneura TaxID=428564 RepID=A0A8D8YWB4_9HEMI